MRTRWLATLMVIVAGLAPALARAAEAPHDESFSDGDCMNCHRLYSPTNSGGTDYSDGCTSCHTDTTSRWAFPWTPDSQANPGFGGNHHSWSAYADKPSIGASTPSNYALAKYVVDGRLQCAVCHDTHFANGWAVNNVPDTSMALGASSPTAAATVSKAASNTYDASGVPGNGQLALMGVANGVAPTGFRLRVQTFSGTAGSFVISHTFGKTQGVTWLQWSAGTSSWIAGAGTRADGADAGTGKPFTVGNASGQNVTLDNTSVTVRWISGTPKVGDYWDVWVSYPFLRMPVAQLCVQCHKDQAMGHERVSGNDPGYLPNGSRIFSHPIGEGLNANGRNTDRTASNPDANARAILDASGVAQTSGDGNATNDYLLDGSGAVQCTTCHAVHNADSNSLTVDKR